MRGASRRSCMFTFNFSHAARHMHDSCRLQELSRRKTVRKGDRLAGGPACSMVEKDIEDCRSVVSHGVYIVTYCLCSLAGIITAEFHAVTFNLTMSIYTPMNGAWSVRL